MKLLPYIPKRPLSRFIEAIWVANGLSAHKRERVLPNGAIELIINLGSYHKVVNKVDERLSEVYRKSWIAGLQEESILIEAVNETDLIGIRFRPGGAYPFLHFPVSELTNRVLESDAIMGSLLNRLRETLIETQTLEQRIRLIENFLMRRMNLTFEDPIVAYALREMSRGAGHRLIHDLSREVGLSNKQLISRFRKVVGASPKMLSRILRFQAVLQSVKNQNRVCWTIVAQRYNYYDQAHLIREFQLLSDSNPSHYLRHRDHNENHVVVA